MNKFSSLLPVLVVIATVLSCNPPGNGYVIVGDIGEPRGEWVVLKQQRDMEQWEDTDSVRVDKAGRFRFTGRVDQPEFVYVHLTKKNKFIRFFLENAVIEIQNRYDSILLQPWVAGSATQDTFRNFRGRLQKQFNAPMHRLNTLYRQANDTGDTLKMQQILNARDSLMNAQEVVEKDFIVSHSSSVLAPFMITVSYMNYSLEELDSLMQILDPALDSTLYVRILQKRIENRRNSLPGNPAPAFTLNDASDHPFNFPGDLLGNYVLLNFWASWNQRSVNYYKNLTPLYDTYHDRGLEIVSVALDTRDLEWKLALRNNNLPGITLRDPAGPRGEVPAKYNITGFPQVILIDPEGMIQSRMIELEEVRTFLKSVFE